MASLPLSSSIKAAWSALMVEEEYLGVDLESVEILGEQLSASGLRAVPGFPMAFPSSPEKTIIRDGWLGEGTCGGCRHRSPDDSGVPRSGI